MHIKQSTINNIIKQLNTINPYLWRFESKAKRDLLTTPNVKINSIVEAHEMNCETELEDTDWEEVDLTVGTGLDCSVDLEQYLTEKVIQYFS